MPSELSSTLKAMGDWRQRSLLRANLLVFLALMLAFRLSDFPQNRLSMFLLLPLLIAAIGTLDTLRCMRSRWN